MKPYAPLLAFLLALAPGAALADLKPGDAAPDFSTPAAVGGKDFRFSLAEALKKGPVVVYFYPKSFTPGCTVEAHEFADNYDNFTAAGASVIGLSGDTIETQREFSTKECRDKFPVGADADLSIAKSYSATMTRPGTDKAFASRTSYVVGQNGKVLYAFTDRNGVEHVKNTLEFVRKLKAEKK